MAKDVTLADIAARIGVSNVAVSKALSGKPGVSDELRSRIKKVADELGYVSNSAGKVTMDTGNIGVVVPENYYGFFASFYGKLYERVVKVLYDHQYYGILEILTEEDEKKGKIPRLLLDEKVDGLIFLGPASGAYVRMIADKSRIPVFFLDTYVSSMTYDTVISDGYYGMYLMTDYLIQQGFQQIGFVGSVDATSSIADRFWGYRRALRENGIEFQQKWEIPDRDEEGRTFETILTTDKVLEAYVCNCDFTAQRFIRNLENVGYQVPEDVSVTGFDNFLPTGMESDQITTYEVDMERMAQTCVDSLIKKMKHKDYVKGIQVINGRIVEKQSVKKRSI